MKTILKIDHLRLILPPDANVTLLLKTLSKAKRAEYNDFSSRHEQRYTEAPIRELGTEVIPDEMVTKAKAKRSDEV